MTTVTLGVMSVFCVFGVGLNSLCILCIWGPQNRSTTVVYFGVFGPPTLSLVYLTPRTVTVLYTAAGVACLAYCCIMGWPAWRIVVLYVLYCIVVLNTYYVLSYPALSLGEELDCYCCCWRWHRTVVAGGLSLC